MAIAFGRAAGNAASGSPASPIVVTVTINAGETAVLHFVSVGGTGGVTSITGGGTWTKRTSNIFTGTSRINSEIWTTDAGAAAGAASVSVAYNGAPVAIACEVGAYTGVLGIGVAATPVGQSTSSPTISLATQDANNWIIGAFGSDDFSEAPATYTASGAGVTNRGDAGVSAATDAHTAILDNTRATVGSVSVAITYAAASYSVVALELRTVSGSATPAPLLGSLLVGPNFGGIVG
jgi:hypothetical protein